MNKTRSFEFSSENNGKNNQNINKSIIKGNIQWSKKEPHKKLEISS